MKIVPYSVKSFNCCVRWFSVPGGYEQEIDHVFIDHNVFKRYLEIFISHGYHKAFLTIFFEQFYLELAVEGDICFLLELKRYHYYLQMHCGNVFIILQIVTIFGPSAGII